jgi:hypothetical protein
MRDNLRLRADDRAVDGDLAEELLLTQPADFEPRARGMNRGRSTRLPSSFGGGSRYARALFQVVWSDCDGSAEAARTIGVGLVKNSYLSVGQHVFGRENAARLDLLQGHNRLPVMVDQNR